MIHVDDVRTLFIKCIYIVYAVCNAADILDNKMNIV